MSEQAGAKTKGKRKCLTQALALSFLLSYEKVYNES